MNARLHTTVAVCFAAVLNLASPLRAADQQVFDVPKLDGIAIDGKADDWGDRGFRVDELGDISGRVKPAANFDARFRLGWNERGFLVLVTVKDDGGVESTDDANLWQGDGVELFLANKRGGTEMVQCLIAPGVDPKYPALRKGVLDHRKDAALLKKPVQFEAARTAIAGGYVIETLIPWDNIAVTPKEGDAVGFMLYADDSDKPGDLFNAVWYHATGTYQDSNLMQVVRLAATPSQPVLSAARAEYKHVARIEMSLVANSEQAGKTVRGLADGKEIARGVLAKDGDRATAILRAPLPPPGKMYDSLVVAFEGQAAPQPLAVKLPDADDARARRFVGVTPAFSEYFFGPGKFPACDFDKPLETEALIGLYQIRPTFYDADYNEVARPQKPGRYGAVVKIDGENGKTYTRYATLYCEPKSVSWWQTSIEGTVQLPEGVGIDPAVAATQKKFLLNQMKLSMAYDTRNDSAAVVLAALSEMKPGDAEATHFESPAARNMQWWVGLKRKLNGNDKRFTKPFEPPKKVDSQNAPRIHPGTAVEAGFKDGAGEKIDAALTEWITAEPQAFTALVARHGVIVHHKAYGLVDGKAATLDTTYPIASLTKMMHGTLVAMFVDQGLMSLDAPVSDYLPELKGVKSEKPITVRHLMTMTAGMSDHWGDNEQDFELRAAELYPYLKVGQKFEYNGASLSLTSKAMEQISGEALPALYKRHLFGPLECTRIGVTNSSSNARSNALDLARVGQMILNGGAYGSLVFMQPKSVEMMLPEPLTKVLGPDAKLQRGLGMSWYSDEDKETAKNPLGKRITTHGSATRTRLLIDLDHDLLIVIARGDQGPNPAKYEAKLLQVIAENIADAGAKKAALVK